MTDSFDHFKTALADRYAIEHELGAGGMATVYLAEDLKHHRKVAVKVMRPELAAALGPERFLREIEISARLRHPHILPLYDSGEADGFLYYVMPHVAGESLRDRLDREQQLPIDDALQITGEVADALHYAHEQNVVHRDIKPENILLESGHAVVADFGIARAVAQAGGERLTETGLSVGTPTYMSPEQASGGTEVDGRSDVFALATVLYEMLVGEPPFTGPNAQAIIAKTLTGDVPPLTGRRSTVSASLDRAVTRALAKVPADRFATAGMFATALKGLATTEATGAPLRAPTGRLRPALAGAGIVAIAVVAWFFTRSEVPTPADGDRPSMAVLPFENLGAPENEYFADGMAEEMISQLAEISGLLVRSRTSTLQYKGTTKTLTEIGGELRVDYVLEGTVRTDRSPDGTGQVRVTPQLIRVSDDTHLWTDRYTASLGPGEVFAVQAEIAEQVAAALNVTLLGDEREALGAAPTVNQEAYDTYLLGRYQWNQRTPATLLAAAEQFQRAIELDPTFAEAVVGLAETYAVFEPLAVPGYRGGEGYALAAAAARRAIALDSTLVGAHATLGYALTFGEWDWDAAESAFDRALALDPEYAVTYYWYAQLDFILGRLDDGLEKAERAVQLDPVSAVARVMLAASLSRLGRFEDAIPHGQVAIDLAPAYIGGPSAMAATLLAAGRWDAAEDYLAVVLNPEIASAIVASRRDPAARDAGLETIRRYEAQGMSAAMLARASVSLGAVGPALTYLERAITERNFYVTTLFTNGFDLIRSDPRYDAILDTLGLSQR